MLTRVMESQRATCLRYRVDFFPSPFNLKVGISRAVGSGQLPLNGLRHSPEGDTTGWYLWSGEYLDTDPDFFQPMHVEHLLSRCPEILPYLALPPGYRFLVAPDYEDVWEDPSLLEI
jgi:hypothetical protein